MARQKRRGVTGFTVERGLDTSDSTFLAFGPERTDDTDVFISAVRSDLRRKDGRLKASLPSIDHANFQATADDGEGANG